MFALLAHFLHKIKFERCVLLVSEVSSTSFFKCLLPALVNLRLLECLASNVCVPSQALYLKLAGAMTIGKMAERLENKRRV